MKVYFFDRLATAEHPAGFTVSKRAALPGGDFRITEYCWGHVALWFVDADKFTADERQAACEYWLMTRPLPLTALASRRQYAEQYASPRTLAELDQRAAQEREHEN